MKRLLLSLALAAAVFPVAASAQEQTPPGPPTQAQQQQMRADFQQMRKLHEQYRAQLLGALTPEHRRLLAQIAGNLAISANPDYRAAAQQLDAALSPGEKNAIVTAERNMRSQMKSMMANMPHPQWQQNGNAPRENHMRKPHERSAGAILLEAASGRMMMMGGHGWGGPHGGPPPEQPQ